MVSSYSAMQYEMVHQKERFLAPLQEFSRLRIDTRDPSMPVLYVAMATWIPKCNMYQDDKYVMFQTTIMHESVKDLCDMLLFIFISMTRVLNFEISKISYIAHFLIFFKYCFLLILSAFLIFF